VPAGQHLPILLDLSRKISNLIFQLRRSLSGHILAGLHLREELHAWKCFAINLVSLHMVAMPVRIDDPAHRLVREFADLLKDSARGCERRLRINHRHRLIKNDYGGVRIVKAIRKGLQRDVNTWRNHLEFNWCSWPTLNCSKHYQQQRGSNTNSTAISHKHLHR
jgi:hypothetical protein